MFEFPPKGARPVWIASYPRSGNTFLRILLEKFFQLPSYSIYYVEGNTHRDPSAEALEDAPILPRNWTERLNESESSPQVAIKTHDAPTDNSAAIYIVRDGRAAIDSYFHYHQKFAFEQPSLTEIIAGACQFGSWSDHFWAWHPKTRPNTLLIGYDELVSNPQAMVVKMAEFLNREPARADMPEFKELQTKLPAFFRRGKNADYLKQWTPGHMALFNELHGNAMADLGFTVEPASGSAVSMLKELAQSASRLHRLYLEQLSNLGIYEARHQQELKRLENQMRDFSGEMEQIINPLLGNRWVRLGIALGAVEAPKNRPEEQELPRVESPQTTTEIKLKPSDGNSRSS